jgi:ABC-2 type transport system permease protein
MADNPFRMAYFSIFRANLLAVMEYRISFLAQVTFMMLNNAFFLVLWYLFFERFGTIGGLDFRTYVLLQAFMMFSFGIHHSFFMGSWHISSKIISGSLDSELLLPKNPFLRILFSRTEASAIGDILAGILIFVFMYSGASWGSFLTFLITAFFSGVILAFTVAFVQSLAFFVGDTKELSGGVFELLLGPSSYPPDIFRETSIKFLFYSVIPVFFVIWLPFDLVRSFDLV